MNEIIDLGFIAAKLAAIKDEKARMIIGGASLMYNISQIVRFRTMIVELSQLCSCIVYSAQTRGFYTEQEYNMAIDCQRQIEECSNQITKYGTMSVIDGISLLIDGLNKLSKR